ncbi:MAG: ABC transporter ATP-binding protein [Desulfatiglandales bacterium]
MPDAPTKRTTAVHMKGIVKNFPEVKANQGVNFRIKKGEIHSLLGENGAGKTTLMKILSGVYRPDAGEIFVEDRKVSFRSPRDALDHGIGMIHQHFQLVDNFTVTENIILGTPGPVHLNMAELEKTVAELTEHYGLAVDSRARIWELSVGEQQRVEILRMLFRKVKILIMDEPTAVLAPHEIERLFTVMRRIRKEGGSVVFITHKLEEVLEISDYITVLRRGKVMSTVRPEKVLGKDGSVSTELARMMVGREVILEVGRESRKTDKVLLRVENLSVKADRGELAVRDMTFSVRYGEIFAVLGVAGNGQRELVESLMGLRPRNRGRILLEGEDMAENLGKTAYVPEDRSGRGSVPDMSLLENLALTNRTRFSSGPLMNWNAVEEDARMLIARYNIAAPNLSMTAGQLSGGNLQKLILARSFSQRPLLLIAEQPTRGLDIGATQEIWQALLRQREEGAVLLVSGDLKEVLSLADNVLVMFRGQIMDILSCGDESALERIGPLMAGLKGQS